LAQLSDPKQLIQALADAGITDQAQVTVLFRLLLQQALLLRQSQLAGKIMAGVALTVAEKAEYASNETALSNLAQLIYKI
jgi:hypothetical protein